MKEGHFANFPNLPKKLSHRSGARTLPWTIENDDWLTPPVLFPSTASQMGFHVLRAPPFSSSTTIIFKPTSSASFLFKFGYALYSSPFSKSSSSTRTYFRASSAKYVASPATAIPLSGSFSRRTRSFRGGFIAATAAPGSVHKSEELRPSISPEPSWVQRQNGTE